MLNLKNYFNPEGWVKSKKCPHCEFLEKYPNHYKDFPHLEKQDEEIGNVCHCNKYDFWEKLDDGGYLYKRTDKMTPWETYREEWRKEIVDRMGLPPEKFEELFRMGRKELEYFYDSAIWLEAFLRHRVIKVEGNQKNGVPRILV